MQKIIDIEQVSAQLKELLSEKSKEVEFILVQDNKPVARIIPISSRVAGLHASAIWTSADFDEPLADEFWAGQ